ncbi:MAG TPA: AAA family ATPase [Methanomassiliicoccales archaeon]|nr:AAA family ATPase [Methanomassiliicoccales archaeon]
MSPLVAVAGKGGVGKSTIAALLVRALSEGGAVLAVDADPNSNLAQRLGVEVSGTVGQLREGLLSTHGQPPRDMSKQEYLRLKLREMLVEGDGFDLLTMGRPEGPGCYCYVNNLLRVLVDHLMDSHRYVVIDNEAGMEHLSRRTARSMDVLLLVSDPTPVGAATAGRLAELADELELKVGRKVLLMNEVREGQEERAEALAEGTGLEHYLLHEDERVREGAYAGAPLKGDEALARELREIIPRLFPSDRRR